MSVENETLLKSTHLDSRIMFIRNVIFLSVLHQVFLLVAAKSGKTIDIFS